MLKLSWTYFILILLSVRIYAQKNTEDVLKARQHFDRKEYYQAYLSWNRILAGPEYKNDHAVYLGNSMMKMDYCADSLTRLIPLIQNSALHDAKYLLARHYHSTYHFEEAFASIEAYAKVKKTKRSFNDDEVSYFMAIVKNARTHYFARHRALINNVGKEVNTEFMDYMPVVTPDETVLYFTSRRPGGNNLIDSRGLVCEDIYVSRKIDGKWQRAENIGNPVNTNVNDACVAISPDAQRMIVHRFTPDGISGDLYITRSVDENKWDAPVKMGSAINSQFIETSACFSNDTSEIFFTSNRPGGYGGLDIYRIRKMPDGRWSAPFNLGPNINTRYDEETPYLHPDGMTLYFSSKGHDAMGEYDVFKSTIDKESGKASKAENLGYPINSTGNDLFFVLNVNGQKAYYSSVKQDSYGGNDIYEIDTRFGDNDLKVKSGVAYTDGQPSRVKITLLDVDGNTVNGVYKSNPKTGKFILVMNPLKSYKAIVEQEGYNTLVVDLDPLASEKFESELEFKLKRKTD